MLERSTPPGGGSDRPLLGRDGYEPTSRAPYVYHSPWNLGGDQARGLVLWQRLPGCGSQRLRQLCVV